MKKVMIGLLILIPIIILLIVALVANIVSLNAHIGVEDLQLTYKGTSSTAYNISIPIGDNICLYDYLDARVYPDKATNKTIEWQIAGEVECTDVSYEQEYNKYAQKVEKYKKELSDRFGDGINTTFTDKELSVYNDVRKDYYYDLSEKDAIITAMVDRLMEKMFPAAVFVDDNGVESVSNTSGKMNIGSYCNFTVRAVAENVSKTVSVSIVGYDVEHVELGIGEQSDDQITLDVGSSLRLLASYTPIDSIVNETIWSSSDESILKVDGNGVVKAVGTSASESSATITLKASVYSTENSTQKQYVQGEIKIYTRPSGASSIFGNQVVTAKSTLTLDEIGIAKDNIDIDKCEGVNIDEDGNVTLLDGVHRIVLKDSKVFSIQKCGTDDIEIDNSNHYDADSGYILAVGENTLSLNLVWKDMLNQDLFNLDNVTWRSSNESIATVDEQGRVVGVGDGIVTITVRYSTSECSIKLNVRKKLSSIQLRTSNEALAIGLARETVFGSEKFVDVNVNNAKVANSTNIIVQGEPEDATATELSSFYSAFSFEIVEGGDFAHLDESIANKVVFDSALLEGKGKQSVVVRVSAKYPKYEGATRFTKKDVTLTVVYGVAVNNMAELSVASKDQEAYVKADGNLIARSDEDKTYWSVEGAKELYKVYKNDYSLRNYAITLNDNCMYEEKFDENNEPIAWVGDDETLAIFGNLYGNNKKIYAMQGTVVVEKYLISLDWGGVTVSNLIMRGNEIGNEDLDEQGVFDFPSHVCDIYAGWGRWSEYDGNNITIEYSIIENGRKGVNLFNTDITFKGCVIRNMTRCGIFAPYQMNSNSDEMDAKSGKQIVYPSFSHINFHNIICSNMLGSMMSVAYESVTMKSGTEFRFVDALKYTGRDDKLIAESKQHEQENERFFIENFYNNDINMSVNQTGFLRAYNWMNVKESGLIKTGNDLADSLVATMLGQIIDGDKETFDKYLFEDEEKEKYLSFAFIVSGVHFSNGIMDAPTYFKLNMQDEDYNCFNMQDANFEIIDIPDIAKNVLSTLSLKVYGYDKNADITPFSTYTLNSALIQELHQNN